MRPSLAPGLYLGLTALFLAACVSPTPAPEPAAPATPAAAPAAPAAAPAPQPAAPQPAAASPRVALDTDTLRLEGTPEIPAAMRQRMRQYLSTRRASLSDISADGKKVLVSTRFGETAQLHLVASPKGARSQLTFLDEPAANGRFVPGDNRNVLYTADIGGNEQHQIFRLDTVSGRTVRLTDAEARNGAPSWSPDGKWIAYASNQRNKRDFDVWVADGKDPSSAKRVLDGKGFWGPVDWSSDNKKMLVGEYISANESRLYALDIASKAVTRISPEGKATYSNAAFGRNGRTVYVASDREGEFAQLYETDITGSKWRSLTRDLSWDVESTALSPDGRTLAFTLNAGGFSALYLLDTRTRRWRAVNAVPKGRVTGMKFAKRAPVLGFTFSSATRPGDAYTYDIRRRKLTRHTTSEMGGLSESNLIEPTLIEFPSFDGTKIPALYFKPKGPGPHPVLVSIHGGPEGQSRPRFSSFTQFALAESGFAVLYPNVRGSSGYGKTYLAMDNGKKREDSVKDIGALLDWIAKEPSLDANRVGVIGGSYGGYMVLASLVHFGDRITAGVELVGISNFVTFLENTKAYRRDLRRVEYGDERDPDMRGFLQGISPANHASKIKSALFVAQGANDPRVPASESEQIVKAVRESGRDVWYMLAKNEGHGFRKKQNSDTFALLSILFFEKHLRSGQ